MVDTDMDRIIRYDGEFIHRFEALKERIESGDRPAIHRFLIDNFGFVFRVNQRYWKDAAEGDARAFDAADEATRRELARPLSHRQYRMVERAFSRWKDEEELVIWSAWDFLHDEERIYEKRVMSAAEVGGFSLILEQVYCCLARRQSD